ncbi:hypothetical protein BD311DRAFT_115618 [Dichomitus squalens]|uniref:Uncharacterized protein n=1 Tax=Dichomitus squalens TaxID=114155 RepID=A0A4Q9MYE6_9APHY|nr:hypothetical protein BD311DRAFT_115618 [Dichomitus squalens]
MTFEGPRTYSHRMSSGSPLSIIATEPIHVVRIVLNTGPQRPETLGILAHIRWPLNVKHHMSVPLHPHSCATALASMKSVRRVTPSWQERSWTKCMKSVFGTNNLHGRLEALR